MLYYNLWIGLKKWDFEILLIRRNFMSTFMSFYIFDDSCVSATANI